MPNVLREITIALWQQLPAVVLFGIMLGMLIVSSRQCLQLRKQVRQLQERLSKELEKSHHNQRAQSSQILSQPQKQGRQFLKRDNHYYKQKRTKLAKQE